MYIARSAAPRVVALPDGSILSLADLPTDPATRWVPRRKAAVANAVRHGLLSVEAACTRYRLSHEELSAWMSATGAGAADLPPAHRVKRHERRFDSKT